MTGEPRSPWRRVPFGVQVAAAWAAVIGLIGVVAFGLVLALAQVRVVVWALAGALLICAVLEPGVARLRAAGVRRFLAAAIGFVGFLVVVAGALALIGRQVADQFDELGTQLSEGLEELREWLSDTFGVSADELDEIAEQARGAVEDNAGGLAGSFTAVAGTAGEIVTGTVLALFLTFFFLADGRRIWSWIVGTFPRGARPAVDPAGERAWRALVAYMRGIIVVALADATLIAVALLVLGVPLVLPLAVLTFMGAFIPLVGAALAGAAAVLVALVAQGPGTALLLVAIVLAVQWIDSDLLQPLILSRAVHLHPVAVALAITTGSLVAGLGGAVAATPLVAAVYAMVGPGRAPDDGP
jgi:predicted PurR-regulated permease PerM